jgi:hypothetical protein
MGEDEDDKEKEYDSDDQGIELMSGIGEELLDVSDKRRQKESLQRMIEDAQLSNDKPGSSRSSPASNNSDPPVPRSYFFLYELMIH